MARLGINLLYPFNINGQIIGAMLTAGNCHDRDAAIDLGMTVDGRILVGGFAYGGPETIALLADEADLLMITRRYVHEHKAMLSSIRQRIETFLGQLCHLFIDTIYSRR